LLGACSLLLRAGRQVMWSSRFSTSTRRPAIVAVRDPDHGGRHRRPPAAWPRLRRSALANRPAASPRWAALGDN
jgi:hypothetical protein